MLYISSPVRLVYGGHVLDPADLDVVESAALACLSKELPLWFSGAHLNIISSLGNFGNFKLSDIGVLLSHLSLCCIVMQPQCVF